MPAQLCSAPDAASLFVRSLPGDFGAVEAEKLARIMLDFMTMTCLATLERAKREYALRHASRCQLMTGQICRCFSCAMDKCAEEAALHPGC